ncbi:TPA: hypothetical protein ACH3X2_008478 [Trebouxia sp. C0005]
MPAPDSVTACARRTTCIHPTPRLWQPSLLHKQALLLQSENLESLVLITRLDTDTALLTSSYAHSLCDHDAHQPATSACHPAAAASTFAAE